MFFILFFIFFVFFFFTDTATTEIYTLSLHDALPISQREAVRHGRAAALASRRRRARAARAFHRDRRGNARSEEHTSELQSQSNLVCRLLLEKKKKKHYHIKLHISTLTPCPPSHSLRT